MKILHLSSERYWRGGERQISFLISELSKEGVENIVLARKKSKFLDHCNENNIKSFSCYFSNNMDFITALKIKSIAHEQKVDFVHAHTPRGHSLCNLASTFGMDTPVIVTKRTVFPIKRPKKYLNSNIVRHIAISLAVKEILISAGVKHSKIDVIYSSIDLENYNVASENFRKQYELEGKFCIANTSALTAEKDYITFLNTAKLVIEKHDHARFIIMGDGNEYEHLKRYVHDLGIADKVVFTGFISNVKEVLSEMDLFCMTSSLEGLGSSILDAMALKLPVVATNAGGMKELVINGKTGFSCNIKDEVCLSQGILQVIENSDLKDSFISESSAFLQDFTIQEMGRKTLELYKNLLS